MTSAKIRLFYDRLKCCSDIDSMFPSETFSKERSLLLFWLKLPDSYASCNGKNFIVSKPVAFRLLALTVPNSVNREITIAFPECNIMEFTLVVIVFSVDAGKVINTRREVVEAVSFVEVLDLGYSPWDLVELRHIFQAFLLSKVELSVYWREIQRHLISKGISHFWAL